MDAHPVLGHLFTLDEKEVIDCDEFLHLMKKLSKTGFDMRKVKNNIEMFELYKMKFWPGGSLNRELEEVIIAVSEYVHPIPDDNMLF